MTSHYKLKQNSLDFVYQLWKPSPGRYKPKGVELVLKKIAIAATLAMTLSVSITSCGGSSTNSIDAYVFLYDISVSPELTSYTPFDRRDQLLSRLATSYGDNQALYFDFVRRDSGRQQVTALVPPSFYVSVQEKIDEDINDSGLRDKVDEKLQNLWSELVGNQALADSISCSSDIKERVNEASNGFFSTSTTSRIASKFCSTVRSALKTINEIPVVAETWQSNGIGSGVQTAVNTAIDKLESEEIRIQRRNPEVSLNPTIVLTSDFNEVHDNLNFVLAKELESVENPEAACQMGTEAAGELEQTELNIILESDGFGTVQGGHVDGVMRDKFEQYWSCWFDTRGISDVNIGDRGVDWSTL